MEIKLQDIIKAHKMHETARKKWFGGRDKSEEDYRKDISILEECVRQNADIEPVRIKVILKHYDEIQKYDALKEAFETGNVPNALRDYIKVFDDFDELYRLEGIEEKEIEKTMIGASYINF